MRPNPAEWPIRRKTEVARVIGQPDEEREYFFCELCNNRMVHKFRDEYVELSCRHCGRACRYSLQALKIAGVVFIASARPSKPDDHHGLWVPGR